MKNRIWNSIKTKLLIGALGASLAFSGAVSGVGSVTAYADLSEADIEALAKKQAELAAQQAIEDARSEAIAAWQQEYDKLRISHDNGTAEQQQKVFDIMQEAKENVKKMTNAALIESYQATVLLEMDRVYNVTPADVSSYLGLADTAKMIQCKYGDIVTLPF
ncbi:MAG: hypothetical protein IJ589_08860, partial [Lachnospiraceae bacterium]|nr:hypothetical protein [Lachnospiraceae bacterium]